MSSFVTTAGKRVTDIRGFLRDAAGGSSIKYVAEKGTKHLIYIPYQLVDNIDEHGNTIQTKEVVAMKGDVHGWQGADGKYKSTVCLKDVIRKSDDGETLLNDGTCPFCDRVSDAWDIYRYRKEMEEASCKLTGTELENHMRNTNAGFRQELKAKEAETYLYILVVKYRQSQENFIIGADGLPEYDLKVMRLPKKSVDKIQQQISNAGAELPGAEVIFDYPNTEDIRLLYSQRTISLVFPNNMMVAKYPSLANKINEDVNKFSFEGIEKSFSEWAGMTSFEAKKVTDTMFEQWDKYVEDCKLNPGARYMEYITNTPVTTPQLTGVTAPTAEVPGVPSVPSMGAPTAPTGMEAPTIPSIPDANDIFGSAASGGIKI